MSEEKIEKGKQLVKELAGVLREIPDGDVRKLFDPETVDVFLHSILDPTQAPKSPSIVQFLLENKDRAALLSAIRLLITLRYSFYAKKDDQEVFCSPTWFQWYDDGVMFLSGEERFAGIIGLYRENEVKYAIVARPAKAGEELSKDDFEFLSIKEYEERFKAIPPEQISDLDKPIRELQDLLEAGDNDESKYQDWLQKYPWILGVQYGLVEGHRKLDDATIPDFTGQKVQDSNRDVFEIKPPFTKLFNEDGSFSSKFLKDWSQTKRYLNFAIEEKDYLRRKGLIFENPKGYLITGYKITEEERRNLRIEERLTPAAQILTWDELIEFAKSTVEFVKRLKQLEASDSAKPDV